MLGDKQAASIIVIGTRYLLNATGIFRLIVKGVAHMSCYNGNISSKTKKVYALKPQQILHFKTSVTQIYADLSFLFHFRATLHPYASE
jgi:hypothetical protein